MYRFLVAVLMSVFGFTAAARAADDMDARREAYLKGFAARDLPQGHNPLSWVDTERWCVAHACMTRNVRLDEANRYFTSVEPVSLSRGLIADTDVQVTDLLRTYLQFHDDKRLAPAARKHLETFLRDWHAPNTDRNRDAEQSYEWPAEYTENHSLNILTAAYLIDHALTRDRIAHRTLLERFLGDRAAMGWSEMCSPQYGLVTAKALSLLADFAPDKNIADAARMHLDILLIEFANHGVGRWRGVPFVRGAGRETDNTQNSYFEPMRFWFGDPRNPVYTGGDPFLVHLLTSKYRPPEVAAQMIANPEKRGRFVMLETGTTGAARLRVPVTVWITPVATMASAQGYGGYYQGCYWSISFASDPRNVVTGNYGNRRNILQARNVMATFGTVTWHGGLNPKTEGNITIGSDGNAFVGQIEVAPQCHLLMVADKGECPDEMAFRAALDALKPAFADGVLTWTMREGRVMRMVNERDGQRWRMTAAFENDRRLRIDSGMRFASPYLQSAGGSRLIEVWWNGRKTIYNFADMTRPTVTEGVPVAPAPIPPDQITGALDGMELLYIPPGEFPMGSPPGEGRSDERPMRWVDVDGFYMSKTEVTVGQWKQYLAANPNAPKPPDWFEREWGKTDNYPMTWVSWDEARAFCDWLTKKSGKRYTLPTEAQWEKAAKGYSHRVYPWGDSYDGTQSGTPNETYAPVGAKPSDVSPFGVMDMAGNAWEWCLDGYDARAYDTPAMRNPVVAGKGDLKVLRGCGWNFDPETFRCSVRSRLEMGQRSVHIGFRVACER
ncbi:MAG: formylglycine-generating enzyme family protein [Planctomycetes bacterium]|nr:formylglycine-generating enzyme family protein [Planctomycetota bacterium]